MKAAYVVSIFFVCAVLGCKTQSRFSQIDLSAPSWHVRTGQAVWSPGREKPEIVGDLVISTNEVGIAYLQFSKTVPIVSARADEQGWELEVAAPHHRYSGRGRPPARVVWFQLFDALDRNAVSEPWRVAEQSPALVSIENSETGERLEVHF